MFLYMSKSIYDVEFCDEAGEDALRKACRKMQEDNARLLQSHEHVQDWNDKLQKTNTLFKQAQDIDLIQQLHTELKKANNEMNKANQINRELSDELKSKAREIEELKKKIAGMHPVNAQEHPRMRDSSKIQEK